MYKRQAMSSVQKLEQLSVKPKEIRLSVLQSELQETARMLALSKKVSVLVPSGGTVCIDHGLFLTEMCIRDSCRTDTLLQPGYRKRRMVQLYTGLA